MPLQRHSGEKTSAGRQLAKPIAAIQKSVIVISWSLAHVLVRAGHNDNTEGIVRIFWIACLFAASPFMVSVPSVIRTTCLFSSGFFDMKSLARFNAFAKTELRPKFVLPIVLEA